MRQAGRATVSVREAGGRIVMGFPAGSNFGAGNISVVKNWSLITAFGEGWEENPKRSSGRGLGVV